MFSLLIISCKKDIKLESENKNEEIATVMPVTSNEKEDLYKQLAEFILKTAKYNVDFKKHVYSECYNEYQGDTYIRIKDLIAFNEQNGNVFWGIEETENLEQIAEAIRNEDPEEPYEPILFVPFIEEVIENETLQETLDNCESSIPEGVIGSEYNSETLDCPAYTLDENDILIDAEYRIDETHAWENDVWVFIQEENVEEGVGEANTYNQVNSDRYDGIPEYGGIIQITDLGEVEPWIAGKLELKYIVFNQNGTKIKEKAFKSTKRKKFKDSQWVDYDDFIGYWNLSNIGNWMIEAWAELDGGADLNTITQTFPAPCASCPTTTVSYTIKNRDEDLGQSLVQFTDPYTTVYNVTNADFMRKTR